MSSKLTAGGATVKSKERILAIRAWICSIVLNSQLFFCLNKGMFYKPIFEVKLLFYIEVRILVDLNTFLWEKPNTAKRSWVFTTGSSSTCRKNTSMWTTRATKQETIKIV